MGLARIVVTPATRMGNPVQAVLVARQVEDGLELHDPLSGSVHRLNAVASAVWRLCDGAHAPEAIAVHVARRFGMNPGEVASDVQSILVQFADVGLIRVVSSASRGVDVLLRCVRVAVGGSVSPPPSHEPNVSIDWDAFIRLAIWHGVLPLVRQHLVACSPEPVPPVVLERLNGHYEAIAASNQRLLHELLELLEMFEQAGIPAFSLKGPLLAALVYGDVTARHLSDLDIFIPPDRAAQASVLLRSRSYTERESGRSGLVAESADGAVSIDLQWAISQRGWHFPVDLADIWHRLEPVSIEGRTVWLPPPDDCLLFLCAHGATHCWCSLKWIVDIAMMLRQYGDRLDWGATLDRARRGGGRRQLLLGLQLASDVLGAPLPAGIGAPGVIDPSVASLASELRERLFVTPAVVTHQGSYGYFEGRWLYVRTRERLRDRMPFLLEVVRHTVTPNDLDRAVVTLPRALGWLYYLVRPFRLATRGIGRRRRVRRG